MAFVTFVIASIGRATLERTVSSLKAQTDDDWNAVIFFDGVEVRELDDGRIKAYQGGPTHNCGLARNEAIPHVTGEWTAFVDDDDYLLDTYIERLRQYGKGFDVVQFTFWIVERGEMPHALKPAPHIDKITAGEMGVSFAVRTAFREQHGILFTQGIYDDYRFLAECEQKGARINITHDIQYIVPKIGHQGVLVKRL